VLALTLQHAAEPDRGGGALLGVLGEGLVAGAGLVVVAAQPALAGGGGGRGLLGRAGPGREQEQAGQEPPGAGGGRDGAVRGRGRGTRRGHGGYLTGPPGKTQGTGPAASRGGRGSEK